MKRPIYLPDNFTLSLLCTVALASVLPASGRAAQALGVLTTAAVALLFFLHGAKLSRQSIIAGLSQWRLHLLVFATTFMMFPLLGIVLAPVLSPLVTPELYTGVLFLCMLPSTVQSAIAFTSIARGNVPAAICSASASTVLGVFVTPVLVHLLVLPNGAAAFSYESIGKIVLQLMLPFALGHLLRPWLSPLLERRSDALSFVDRGSILLVVYGAFSAAVIEGLWSRIPSKALLGLLVVCIVLLVLVLVSTTLMARSLGFSDSDSIAIVFCGSKKSLASGVPMAQLLFAPAMVGTVVLPIMLFHQIQLMCCSVLAQRYRKAAEAPAGQPAENNSSAGSLHPRTRP